MRKNDQAGQQASAHIIGAQQDARASLEEQFMSGKIDLAQYLNGQDALERSARNAVGGYGGFTEDEIKGHNTEYIP
jgi:hypothetical protein